MNTGKLTRNERCRAMASELMIEELARGEVLSIIKKYFEDCKFKNLANIALCGMNFSFYSDEPFFTAGIYYKNIIKTSEMAKLRFNQSLIRAFKNMILEMSKTNIKIKNPEEYRKIRQEFAINFDQKPPKSKNILNVILKDEKAVNRMVKYPELYLRVKEILKFADDGQIKEIKSLILMDLKGQLDVLKSKNPKDPVNQDKIYLEIHFLEKKIKLISRDDEWVK